MRKQLSTGIELMRVVSGPLASRRQSGPNGAFFVTCPHGGRMLRILAHDGISGPEPTWWEHVSVTIYEKPDTPTWEEMAWVKDRFFLKTETVMQLHVPAADHVNDNIGCLHLWRPLQDQIPRPPQHLV